MATRDLAVRFTTQGFDDLRKQLSSAGKSFDDALKKAKDASQQAIADARAAAGDTQALEEAQKSFERAARQANNAVAGSFRELRIKSTADIEAQKKAAISAFEAIEKSGTASAQDIANAQAALKRTLESLDDQLDQTNGKVGRLGEGFTILKGVLANLISGGIQAGLSAIANTIQSITRGIIGFGQASVGAFMSFDGAMKAFMAKSGGATEEQIKAVREETEKLGMATSKTPTQIAQMAASLAGAGFSAEETKDSLAGIVMAAEASGESLDTVGSIVGAAINQFRLEAKDSQYIADVLTAGANASATSISGLGEGLKYIGAIAGGANQNIEDMTIVLGLLTNAGLEAGQAGRNFASAFERVANASAGISDGTNEGTAALKAQQEALQKLGVQFRQADGQMRPFLEVLPELAEQYNKLSFGDQDLIRKQLFGTEGGRAIVALLSQVETKLGSVTDAVRKSEGAAGDASEQLMKGLGPAIELLQSSMEVLQKNLGEALAPAMEFIVRATTGWVNELIKTEGILDPIKNLSEEIKKFFEENPAIIETINREMSALVQDALNAAVGLAEQLFGFLKENPTAIADLIRQVSNLVSGVLKAAADLAKSILEYFQKNPDAIDQMISGLRTATDWMGKFYNFVKLSVEGWEKIYNYSKWFSGGGLPGELGRLSPTSALERLSSSGADGKLLTEFQKELDKRLTEVPWWQPNNAKREEIVKEVFTQYMNRLGLDPFGNPLGQSAAGGGVIGALNRPSTIQKKFNQNDFTQTSGFVFPVPGGNITGDQGDGHRGLDVFAPVGTPILASLPGTIVQAMRGGTVNTEDSNPGKPGYQSQHSVKVKLDTPIQFDGKTINYYWNTHLTSLAPGIQVGARVNAGDKLGEVGMAGGAPHLHQAFSEVESFRGNTPLSNRESLALYTAIKLSGGATPQTPTASGAMPSGVAAPQLTPSERKDLIQMMAAEATGEGVAGMAAVGRAILNRSALIASGVAPKGTGGYGAKSASVSDVIRGKNAKGNWEFSPMGDGRFQKQFSADVMSQAEQAFNMLMDTNALKGLGLSDATINSPNFQRYNLRTPGWWQGGFTRVGDHHFGRDKFSANRNVSELVSKSFTTESGGNTPVSFPQPSGAAVNPMATPAEREAAKAEADLEKVREQSRRQALKRREQQQEIEDQEAIADLKERHEITLEEMRRNQADELDIKQEQAKQSLELRKLETNQAIAQLKKERAEIEAERAKKLKTPVAEQTPEQQAADYSAEIKLVDLRIQQQEKSLKRATDKINREFVAIAEDRAKTESKRQQQESSQLSQFAIEQQKRRLDIAEQTGQISQENLIIERANLEIAGKQLEIQQAIAALELGVPPEQKQVLELRIKTLTDEIQQTKVLTEYQLEQLEIQKEQLSYQADYEQIGRLIEIAEREGNYERAETLKLLQAQYDLQTKIAEIKQRGLRPDQESTAIAAENRLYELNKEDILNGNQDLGQSFRELLSGPLSEFFQGAIDGTKSLSDAFNAMAQSILGALSRVGAELATNSLLNLLGLGKPQQTQGLGGAIAGLFGGGGGNAVASAASILPGMITPFMGKKFADGGYTGDGDKWEPKGIVHGGEFVINKEATRKIGLPALMSANALGQLPGYATGGYIGSVESRLLSGLNSSRMPSISLPTENRRSPVTAGPVSNTVNVNINDRESRFFKQSRTLAREIADELRNA